MCGDAAWDFVAWRPFSSLLDDLSASAPLTRGVSDERLRENSVRA
jgi:hypothetical protein